MLSRGRRSTEGKAKAKLEPNNDYDKMLVGSSIILALQAQVRGLEESIRLLNTQIKGLIRVQGERNNSQIVETEDRENAFEATSDDFNKPRPAEHLAQNIPKTLPLVKHSDAAQVQFESIQENRNSIDTCGKRVVRKRITSKQNEQRNVIGDDTIRSTSSGVVRTLHSLSSSSNEPQNKDIAPTPASNLDAGNEVKKDTKKLRPWIWEIFNKSGKPKNSPPLSGGTLEKGVEDESDETNRSREYNDSFARMTKVLYNEVKLFFRSPKIGQFFLKMGEDFISPFPILISMFILCFIFVQTMSSAGFVSLKKEFSENKKNTEVDQIEYDPANSG